MEKEKTMGAILSAQTYLGLELGSTRIKAVLIDEDHSVLASGSHNWENSYESGIWTYSLDSIWTGVQGCYADLAEAVKVQYGIELNTVGAIGISAMMHGYLAFDAKGKLLVPFRTWRNTFTTNAANELSTLFNFNIPERWSIAHLYHALLNQEPHLKELSYLTTLSGYIHWQLTNEKVLGIGDASGILPIDCQAHSFRREMLESFNELAEKHGYSIKLESILPKVLVAGEYGGTLTDAGAALLDPSGKLQAGIAFCPPEGDAGTGMVATNSVRQGTGNVSAGTSIFSMVVLERDLEQTYKEIDIVTTPAGAPAAMVHCNNCTGELDAWVGLFGEFSEKAGLKIKRDELYSLLYNSAFTGAVDCGGLLAYNYFAGEPITGLSEGRPLLLRSASSCLSLANLMRAQLYSSVATLSLGMDILLKKEQVRISSINAHGGLFKTENIGQAVLATALNTPVTLMPTAGEGGPWGMAVLTAYYCNKHENENLSDYLEKRVFASADVIKINPKQEDVAGFNRFMERYKAGLPIEQAAVNHLQEK